MFAKAEEYGEKEQGVNFRIDLDDKNVTDDKNKEAAKEEKTQE